MRLRIRDDEFDLNPDDLTFAEAIAIEKVTGMSFGDFTQALQSMSAEAMAAFTWVCRRRSDPTLRFEDATDVKFSELEFIKEPGDDTPPNRAARRAAGNPTRASE